MSASIREFLDREAKARYELSSKDYDSKLLAILDEISALPRSHETEAALLGVASATLRHADSSLVASRARCAELLLSLRAKPSNLELRRRMESLFLLAWLQLSDVVGRGPDSISSSPPLPEGVVLPNGADPEAITDPDLRAQAQELQKQYDEEVERWRAKHLALDKQILLATLVRAAGRDPNQEDKDGLFILAAAMALAPGLPANIRKSLQDFAQESLL
jgi:hypothetical protein